MVVGVNHYRVANPFHLLLLLVELLHLGELVCVQPLNGLVALVQDGLAVVFTDLILYLLVVQGGLHVEAVAVQHVLGMCQMEFISLLDPSIASLESTALPLVTLILFCFPGDLSAAHERLKDKSF